MKSTALILVDIQNDYFPGGKFELEGADAATKKAAKVLAEFRSRQMTVIHVHHEDIKEVAGFFLPGSEGAKTHVSVAPADKEKVIIKHFPNSFLKTDLEQELRSLGVERVVIAGMMTFMCIDATSRAASDLGFEVVVLHDACAAKSLEFDGVEVSAPEVHAASLAALQMFYADVTDTASFLLTL